MIYEMRRYECKPGKLQPLHHVMVEMALPVFKRLDMRVIGVWSVEIGDQDETLIYILEFDDMNDRQAKWDKFWADKEWQEKVTPFDLEHGGPIVSRTVTTFLKAAPYSPIR